MNTLMDTALGQNLPVNDFANKTKIDYNFGGRIIQRMNYHGAISKSYIKKIMGKEAYKANQFAKTRNLGGSSMLLGIYLFP